MDMKLDLSDEKIKELARKFRIEEDKVKYILERYDTIEDFIGEYIKGNVKQSEIDFLGETLRAEIDFDLYPKNKGFDKLARDIYCPEGLIFYSSKSIIELMEHLDKVKIAAINEKYGLESGEEKSLREVSEKNGTSRSNIGNHIQRAFPIMRSMAWEKKFWGQKVIPLSEKNLSYNREGGILSLDERIVEDFIEIIRNSGIIFNSAKAYEEEPLYIDTDKFKVKLDMLKKILAMSKTEDNRMDIEEGYEIDIESHIGELERIRDFIKSNAHQRLEEKLERHLDAYYTETVGQILVREGCCDEDTIETIKNPQEPKSIILTEDSDFYGLLPEKFIIPKDIRIEDLGFSARIYNVLNRKNINITFLSDLILFCDSERMRGIGAKSIAEIKNKVMELSKDFIITEEIDNQKEGEQTTNSIIKEDILALIETKLRFYQVKLASVKQRILLLQNEPEKIVEAYLSGDSEYIDSFLEKREIKLDNEVKIGEEKAEGSDREKLEEAIETDKKKREALEDARALLQRYEAELQKQQKGDKNRKVGVNIGE